MKLNWLTIGTHLGTAMFSGLAVWAASDWGMNAWTVLAVAGGFACITGWWIARRIRQSLLAFDAIVRPDAPPVERSGISEFDQLAKQVQGRVLRWAETTAAAQQGLREAEQLVNQLDHHPHDRTAASGRNIIAHLRQLIVGLMDTAGPDLIQLGRDTGELESKLSHVSSCAADQTEAVSRTTTYVEQLSLQFDAVAEATNAAQNAIQLTRESTQTAHGLLEEHAERIEELQSRMEGTERRIRALKERSQSIQTIIATIGDISSRTDLLALNASIESYRAGEQGRGFSVVADEVRKLAEQSAQSTRDISVLIETIQADADESAHAVSDQRRDAAAEITRMLATGERLTEVGRTCETSNARMRDITQLAGQQLHLIQGLVSAVERISETNRQSRGRLDEANWMARSINKASRNLDDTLSVLRLEEGRRKTTSSLSSRSTILNDAALTAQRDHDAGRVAPAPSPSLSASAVEFVMSGRDA